MANVSKLLHASGATPTFLKHLNVADEHRAHLTESREKIRQRIRETFASLAKAELGVTVRPKFYTQGSYAYRTINNPAWTPPQQMDLDDGTYLPMTFIQNEKRPSVAAASFFKLVDATLEKLAIQEGWEFVRKPTCARLVISSIAHIDVPLYAIPDVEFSRLVEAKMAKTSDGAAIDARAVSVDRWDALPSDCVLLAHRDQDWISSDPRKIHDWFMDAIQIYGPILRRVSRYLKAWRDHNRPHLDEVSSILLMVCAWESFEELGRPNVPSRDDLALLRVAERLPRLLQGPIYNPADGDERIDSRLSDASRQLAITTAQKFDRELTEVIERCFDPHLAIGKLTELFGDRIPDEPSLVDITKAAHAEVRAHPARISAAPAVGKSVSA